ncbi:Response regulator of zinc sigma-54-dependent two-component system [Minicystis rosea]|nr:Response regulator of zinc sigma-54-dependent two-component system [Minicystis rosea]
MSAVLIVEDERGIREGLTAAIEGLGHKALPAPGLADARRLIAAEPVGAILLDIRLRDGNGLDLLRELRSGAHREIPVIVATAYGDSDRTIEAMRDGAFDYLTKPFDLPLLIATVERALRQRELLRALPPKPAPPADGRGGLIGTSAAMLAIWKQIGRAAASDAPVLITGETGSGKELVARAIHDYSPLAKEPFVAVNLAALPPSLMESELFGHEKGAFTGAVARRSGRLELAQGGTLFLDEIGDLDPVLQTKLLRVLQDGRFERVGGSEPITCSARVITATNKPVRPGLAGATLREDLYYRLAVFEMEVPPLRARRSDIPLLVAHALEGSPARAVSEDAMTQLSTYEWPGNVRELLHVIRRAAAMCGGEIIDTLDLPPSVREKPAPAEPELPALARLPLREAVAALEKRMIRDALDRAGGNRSEAARQLGIARAQLYLKMEEYGIGDKKR